MSMDEDRIDIIATLHDRFSKPAEDFIDKMERLEDQADETGESLDDLQDKVDEEAKSTEQSTKAQEQNTRARKSNVSSIKDGTSSIKEATSRVEANNEATQKVVRALREDTGERDKNTEAHRASIRPINLTVEATMRLLEKLRQERVALDETTKSTERLRDARGRFIKQTDKATKSVDGHTKATKENTKETDKNKEAREEDLRGWAKWDRKIQKISRNFGARFKPIGNFFTNYFKIMGMLRGLMTSDIGAMVPMLVSGLKAIGGAALATLGPLGRMAGALGQIAPFAAAFIQMRTVMKIGFGGVADALKVMNDSNATAEEISAAYKEAGKATWDFAKSIQQVQKNFKPIKRDIREAFLKGLGPSVEGLAKTYFPMLNKRLTQTAKIMNGEMKAGIESLQTPEKQGSIDRVMERSAEASGLFTKIMFSLLDVFVELADAAGPSFMRTLEGINKRLENFATWVRNNKEKVTDFFNRAGETAGKVVKAIGDIGRGLYGIAKAAQPLETFLWGGTSAYLDQWADLMNSPDKQKEMRENFEKMIPALQAIGRVLGALKDGFSELGDSPYFVSLMNELADVGIPALVDFFKQLDKNVSPALERISKILGTLDQDNKESFFKPLGDALGGLAKVLETIVPLFNALPDPVQKFVFYGMGLAAIGLPGIFMLMLGPLNLVSKVLFGLGGKGGKGGLVGGIVWVFKKFAGLLVDIAESPFGKKIAGWAGALGRFFKPIVEFIAKHLPWLAKGLGKVAGFLGKRLVAAIPVIGWIVGALWLLWDVIAWLWDNCKPFRDFFTGIWDWIVEAWNKSIDWIVNTAVPWIVDAFTGIWNKIKEVGQSIADFYNAHIKPIVDGIVTLGKIIFITIITIIVLPFYLLYKILRPIIEAVVEWFKKWIPVALDVLGKVWQATIDALGKAWDWLKDAFGVGVDAIKLAIDWLVDAFVWLWDQAKNIWDWIWHNVIEPVVNWITGTAVPIIVMAVTAIAGGFVWLYNQAMKVWKWIMDNVINPVIQWFLGTALPIILLVVDYIVDKFNFFKQKATDVWGWIMNNVIAPFVAWFMNNIWPTISRIIGWVVDKFNWLKDIVGDVWSKIQDAISNAWNQWINPIFDKLKAGVQAIVDSFNTAKDAISKAWQVIQDAAMKPVKFIVDQVYNQGFVPIWNSLAEAVGLDEGKRLKPVSWAQAGGGGGTGGSSGRSRGVGATASMAFSEGGMVGGYQHLKKDEVNTNLRFGEGVLVPEVMRAMGSGWLNILNKIGNSRGVNGVKKFLGGGGGGLTEDRMFGYAGGGVVGAEKTTASSDSDSGVNWGALVSNPFDGFIDTWKGKISSSVGNKGFGQIGTGFVSTMGGHVVDYVAKKIKQAASYVGAGIGIAGATLKNGLGAGKVTVGSPPPGGSGKTFPNWQAQYAALRPTASRFGLVMTSNYRPGARTAGSGITSLHALGRAVDWAGGNMGGFFDWVKANYGSTVTELLYSPKGSGQKSRSSGWHDTSGATKANHYSHVHVGFNRGGVLGFDHMRFAGGPVETWGNTLVGELGPELFFPSNGGFPSLLGGNGPEVIPFRQEGTVLPADFTEALQRGSVATKERPQRKVGNTYNFQFDANTPQKDRATIKALVKQAIREAEREKRERR